MKTQLHKICCYCSSVLLCWICWKQILKQKNKTKKEMKNACPLSRKRYICSLYVERQCFNICFSKVNTIQSKNFHWVCRLILPTISLNPLAKKLACKPYALPVLLGVLSYPWHHDLNRQLFLNMQAAKVDELVELVLEWF